MAVSIQELLDKQKQAYAAQKDLQRRAKEAGEWTPDLSEQWDKAEADYTRLSELIQREKALDEREKVFTAITSEEERIYSPEGKPKNTDGPSYDEAFNKLLRSGARSSGLGELDDAHYRVLQAGPKFKRGTDFQTMGTAEHGGYITPQEWANELIKTMVYYGGMLEAPRIIDSSTGRKWNIPTVPYAGGGASATEKGVLITETSADVVSDITFAEKELDAYTYSSRLIKVSWELLQDSMFDVSSLVRDIAAERIGRKVNEDLTTADGSSKPQGIVPATSLGKLGASTTAIAIEEIIDLEHSVDPAYRRGPKVGFMFNDTTLSVIKKLDVGSSDARPIWLPSFREGEPATILGYRYWINNDMASGAADAKTILFGDFNQYWVRRSKMIELVPLFEKYADTRSNGYFAYARYDGELMDANAIKHFAQASA